MSSQTINPVLFRKYKQKPEFYIWPCPAMEMVNKSAQTPAALGVLWLEGPGFIGLSLNSRKRERSYKIGLKCCTNMVSCLVVLRLVDKTWAAKKSICPMRMMYILGEKAKTKSLLCTVSTGALKHS